ncbi:carboxypeptidase regulatory-like domain-containing protein, partial [bacterium]|nr:carboxypeptidase regulatory-like domain-containing protein [bacterium]
MYHHLNMGWSGNDNAWYDFPDLDSTPAFTIIYKCVYNVFVTGSGELVSGRIVDGTGTAISGATVIATGTGGPFNGASNANGIFHLDHLISNTTYSLAVTAGGYTFTNRNETTGTSTNNQSTAGNLWGVDFIGTAIGNPPATPNITSPTNFQINVSRNPDITSSNFSDPDVGDTHQSSNWEIHDESVPTATSAVWSKADDTGNLLTINISSTNGTFSNALSGLTSLNASTNYWVRVRHKDNNGTSSSWSSSIRFVTISSGNQPAKPSITSPTDGQTDVSSTVTISGNAFSDPDIGDTLLVSEWEIHDALNMSSITLVFSKPNWSSTSIQVNSTNGSFLNCLLNQANLGNFNNYWVRVRYYDNNGLASEWSDSVSFQTTSTGYTQPVQPNISTPTMGQTGVAVTPTITGTAFSDVISGHQRSCWEIFDSATLSPTSRVWYKYNETVNLENIVVNSTNGTFENSLVGQTLLVNNTQYWVRVKYFNDIDASSTWAVESNFITMATLLPPNKPSIVSPTAGEINIAINPDVSSSVFSDPDIGETHLQSDWEVYNSSVINSVNRVWFKLSDTANLTSITISDTNGTYENALSGQTSFALNTQYWVRVRYYDNNSNVSEWSDTQNFMTVVFASSPPDKPVISDPTIGATDIITNPSVTSSAFNDSDPFDTHLRTDWEIYDNAVMNSSDRIWFNTGDTVNFISTVADSVKGQFENARFGQTDLDNGTQYWLRVRYIDNSFTPSDWSDVINFTTVTEASAKPVKPSITSPTSGQNDLAVNPVVSGNAFSDPDTGDTHKQSDWEVYTGSTPVASERVWYKFNDTTYLVSSRVDPSHGTFENALSGASYLAYSTQYYVRVRYSDNTDVYSDWSDMIGFITSTTLNNVPNAPLITSPIADETGIDPNAPLSGSVFADPDPGDSHFESDWEVYDNPSLFATNLVWSSPDDPVNLTSTTVNTTLGTFANALSGQTSLAYLNDYYARLRYQDNLGNISNWSGVIKFTTGEQPNNPADKPIVTSPTDSQVNVDINLDIITSAFNDPDAGDTHKQTDWEIYDTAMTNPANLVWSSLIDTVNLTTITVDSTSGTFSNALSGQTALGFVIDYWLRVRYHDSRDMTTEWSDIIPFKTRSASVNPPNKPQITYPTADLTGVIRNVRSTANAFSDADVADTHQKTDWRIYDNQSLESSSIVWECVV